MSHSRAAPGQVRGQQGALPEAPLGAEAAHEPGQAEAGPGRAGLGREHKPGPEARRWPGLSPSTAPKRVVRSSCVFTCSPHLQARVHTPM